MWKFITLEHQNVLIRGEVGTGKTRLTQRLLEEAEALGRKIAVIDMAPEPQNGAGGKLNPGTSDYYTTDIETPRLSGTTEKEIVELAELNKQRIEDLFNIYKPRDVLFMNDVSMYLQRGNVERIVSVMSSSRTCILNGYFGTSLGEDSFSEEERRKMIELQKFCDIIIRR
jgi:hypothetical protein